MGQMKRYDQDAFSVKPASKKETDDLYTVVGQVSILRSYMDKVMK